AGGVRPAPALRPLPALPRLLVLGAALDMGLGVLIFAVARATQAAGARAALLYALATGVLVVAIGSTTALDPLLLSSGVFRSAALPPPGARTMLFQRDGRPATRAVFRTARNRPLSLPPHGQRADS